MSKHLFVGSNFVPVISGGGNAPVVLAPGTYDANGNMLKTWAELFEGSGAGGRFVSDGAFYGSEEEWHNMDGAVTVVVDPSITSFGGQYGDNQFCFCKSLVSIVLPDTLSDLGAFGAFTVCSNLSSIIIPEGVKEIPVSCFSGCSSLTDVHLPNSVTSISGGAFNRCSSITEIIIPDGVVSIGNGAFYDCPNLTTIHYSGTATGAPWGATNATVVP